MLQLENLKMDPITTFLISLTTRPQALLLFILCPSLLLIFPLIWVLKVVTELSQAIKAQTTAFTQALDNQTDRWETFVNRLLDRKG